ncbi:chromate transporter [Alicyclobacillus sp.]|uniref:chromate transporter n=1 Tax=Alicyclobacillus sp. TaxID=61169 RepID=UPI0025C557BE|nr:chromate transporter [Alicyclobacillus sp.]MCL6517548.1 chromate transporter [Alicyclobacillus sp.]
MTWWHVLVGFLLPNLLGYGGGPAMIPLLQDQAVTNFHWLSNAEFANVLALGNVLPGPIATKMATFIGYQVDGWLGVLIALAATIVPSAVALILLMRLLNRHRQSDAVRGMTAMVQPVIAVLMVALTWEIGKASVMKIGWVQSLIIAALSLWLMQWRKVHPALVIVGAFAYGGIVLPLFH